MSYLLVFSAADMAKYFTKRSHIATFQLNVELPKDSTVVCIALTPCEPSTPAQHLRYVLDCVDNSDGTYTVTIGDCSEYIATQLASTSIQMAIVPGSN